MTQEKAQAQPPIIVKKKRGKGPPRRGLESGYVDFVIAMMALFLVLWIVGQNKTVKEMNSKYFEDPGGFAEKVKNGGAGILPDYAPPGAHPDPPPAVYLSKNPNPDMKQLEEEKKKGSSPNRVGQKGTEDALSFRPRGCVPPRTGQHRRENTRIVKRLLGFRMVPFPDPLAENRLPGQIGPTKVFSDVNR